MHSKGNNQQSKKTTYQRGKDICKWYDWHGVNIKKYKQLIQLNMLKKTQKQTTQSGHNTWIAIFSEKT